MGKSPAHKVWDKTGCYNFLWSVEVEVQPLEGIKTMSTELGSTNLFSYFSYSLLLFVFNIMNPRWKKFNCTFGELIVNHDLRHASQNNLCFN